MLRPEIRCNLALLNHPGVLGDALTHSLGTKQNWSTRSWRSLCLARIRGGSRSQIEVFCPTLKAQGHCANFVSWLLSWLSFHRRWDASSNLPPLQIEARGGTLPHAQSCVRPCWLWAVFQWNQKQAHPPRLCKSQNLLLLSTWKAWPRSPHEKVGIRAT